MKWQCRIAPSLGGGFAGTPNEVWGTVDYENDQDQTVFFGLYGLPDFFALWRHRGKKAILWAGSDIRHFIGGYWLDTKGDIRINSASLAKWIEENCQSYVENEIEQKILRRMGVRSQVIPSFLGDVKNYPIQKDLEEGKYYSSVSGNDFRLYGWDRICKIAFDNPTNEYHLYGNTVPFDPGTIIKNVIVHGRVSQEEMDRETKKMSGAIRLVHFEGFSEILAKSILWGQKPVSEIKYDFLEKANPREELLKVLNKYPWNIKL